MPKLAYIGRVQEIYPIPDADRIESLEVVCGEGGKWRGIARKSEYKKDDLCRVFLQDSLLPQTEEFSFMEHHKYRVRMVRLKGTPSEVLIMPIQSLTGEAGTDITEQEGVTKYEKQLPKFMVGKALGYFPSFIPKTDEVNFQRVPEFVDLLKGKPFYSTVKIDGSSCTVFNYKGHFGVCSRNLERAETDDDPFWKVTRKYNLQEKLVDWQIALQFELAGPITRENPLGLKDLQMFLFNIYDIPNNCYWSAANVFAFAKAFDIPTVPVLEWHQIFTFNNDEELRKYAEGVYPNGKQREGVVIRPMEEMRDRRGNRVSFKVINLLYKD